MDLDHTTSTVNFPVRHARSFSNLNKPGFKRSSRSLSLLVIPTYDDVLSSSIRDSFISSSQDKPSVRVSSPDSAFQTGSEFNTTEDGSFGFDQNSIFAPNDKVARWVKSTTTTTSVGHGQPFASPQSDTPGQAAPSSDEQEDIGSIATPTSTSTKTSVNIGSGKIVIEEHLEEIITMNSYSDESSEASGSDLENSDTDSKDIKSVNLDSIIDGAYDVTDPECSSRPLNWQENWLFKKKKVLLRKSNGVHFQTTMFIPNPINYTSQYSLEYLGSEDELVENEDLSYDSEDMEELSESKSEVEVGEITAKLEDQPKELRIPDTNNAKIKMSLEVKYPEKPLMESNHTIRQRIPPSDIFIQATTSPPLNWMEFPDETLRETSQSLIAVNDTIEKPDSGFFTSVQEITENMSGQKTTNIIKPVKLHTETGFSRKTTNTRFQYTGNSPSTQSNTSMIETLSSPNIPPAKTQVEEQNVSLEPLPKVTMRIAEREKQKWNNPVKIGNNPYSPENLLKRISNNSFLHSYGASGGQISDNVEDLNLNPEIGAAFSISNDQKIRRDYYINSNDKSRNGNNTDIWSKGANSSACANASANTKFQNRPITAILNKQPKVKPVVIASYRSSILGSNDLSQVELPSVKDLAQQFSHRKRRTTDLPRNCDLKNSIAIGCGGSTPNKPINHLARKMYESNQLLPRKEIHSITARSVTKQFREGLRLAKPAMPNANIKTSDA